MASAIVSLGCGGYNLGVVQSGWWSVGRRLSQPEKGILALLGLLTLLACVAWGAVGAVYVFLGAGVSDVRILSPPSGIIVAEGETLVVHAVSTGRGLVRSELLADGAVAGSLSSPLVAGVTNWSITHSWHAQPQGQHRLSVRVFDLSGGVVESLSLVVAVPPPGDIVFSSNRTGNYEIFAMRTDGREPAPITSGSGQIRQPSCASKDLLLFTSAVGGGTDIWRMELQTGERSNLTASLGGDRWPRWAPDERSIAFVSDRFGPGQLFLMKSDGSEPSQLTRGEFPVEQPSWAPDGSALVFAAQIDGNWDIYRVSADGRTITRLTEDPSEDSQPAWSPRGDEIAFTSNREGNQQIYIMRADGTAQKRITAFPSGAEQAQWSPDGEWIVCATYTGSDERLDAREIYIMRRDGSDQIRLTDNAFDDTEPDWCE